MAERWLLDTNILLRLVWLLSAESAVVERAIRNLAKRDAEFFFTLQNASEYWNVCTRPPSERGGLGLPPADAASGLQIIETQARLLPDTADVFSHWKRLVAAHQVRGVQVHDAKLIASMLTHGVSHILTRNTGHFRRYSEVQAVSPEDLA